MGRVNVSRLKKQLWAWWEGVDLPDDTGASGAQASSGQTHRHDLSFAQKNLGLPPEVLIAETLWGEGYVGPGGPEFILDLVAKLGISRDKSMAYMGLGLGGPAREICRESGIWITGYEARTDLIELASEQSLMAGLARKVSAQLYEPGNTVLPERKFDIVISRDEFSFLGDRAAILAKIYASLRPGGSFLLTDYVIAPGTDGAALAQSAFSPFWGTASLCTQAEYNAAIQEAGFDLRVKKTLTPAYVTMVTEATTRWASLLKMAQEGHDQIADTAAFVQAMAKEAECWTARLNALQANELEVFRFFALKPESGVS